MHLHIRTRILFFSFLTLSRLLTSFFFFFNDTATTEIYTLSLHDALPIFGRHLQCALYGPSYQAHHRGHGCHVLDDRSEEHTSELQSHVNLVCRLLLEKKKIDTNLHDKIP